MKLRLENSKYLEATRLRVKVLAQVPTYCQLHDCSKITSGKYFSRVGCRGAIFTDKWEEYEKGVP